MILKSIKLENIRSYMNEEIKFPEGSVLLSGDIGSGKSTILLAIEFALFGLRRTHLPGSALLRHGKKEGSVELQFIIEDKEIIIKRILKRQNSEIQQAAGFIVKDDIKTEATAVELKAKVLELLGYPKSELSKSKDFIYRYTVYTPQEQMKQILLEEPDFRLDTLRNVFGIDKYKRIRENASILTKALKERISLYKGQTADLDDKSKVRLQKEAMLKQSRDFLDTVLPKLETARRSTLDVKESIADTEKRIEELNKIRTNYQLQDTKLEEISKQYMKNSEDIKAYEAQISELAKTIESTVITEPANKNKRAIERQLSALESDIKARMNKKTQLVEKSSNSEKVMLKLESEIKQKTDQSRDLRHKQEQAEALEKELENKKLINRRITEVDLELVAINKKISELETKLQFSDKVKESISSLSNCPTCLQEVPGEHKQRIIESESAKAKELYSEITSLRLKKTELETEKTVKVDELESLINKDNLLTRLKAEIANLNILNREIVEKQKEYSEISLDKIKTDYEIETLDETGLTKMENELKLLKEQLDILHDYELKISDRKNKIESLEERNKIRSTLMQLNEALKKQIGDINMLKLELSKKIQEFREFEVILKRQKLELDAAIEKEKVIEVEKSRLETEIKGLEAQVEELNKEIMQKTEAKSKLLKLNSVLDWTENRFINLMSIMEKQILATVYTEFNEYLQKWFKVLMEDETISIRLNEDFSPIIEQNGYETSIENLSGGEKTAASLAYRLALNKVINDVQSTIKTKDIIILDEPTDGFSSAQLDKVRDVLEQLDIKQVVLVSHESKIESFVDNIIRLGKSEHVSKVMT